MTVNNIIEIDETLEFERTLKEEMAGAPVMSQTRLVFAEMLVLCMTYRELLECRVGIVGREGFGNF